MQRSQANRNPGFPTDTSASSTDPAKTKAWRGREHLAFATQGPSQPLAYPAFDGVDGQSWLSWDEINGNVPWAVPTFVPYSNAHEDQLALPDYGNLFQPSSYSSFQSWDLDRQHPITNDVNANISSVNYLQEQSVSPLDAQYQGSRIIPPVPAQALGQRPNGQPSQPQFHLGQLGHEVYPQNHQSQEEFLPLESVEWGVPSVAPVQEPAVFVNTFIDSSISFVPTPPLALDWSPTTSGGLSSRTPSVTATEESAPKRKRSSSANTTPTASPVSPTGLSSFVVVFENAPGALAALKKRKKLDEPVRKAAKDVRRAGACHQCRFRKRTCSTGTPCGTCLKNNSGMREIKCQRESPFIGKLMSSYFEHSSTRRVVTFDLVFAPDLKVKEELETLIIDGVGRISYPMQLRAQRRLLTSLDESAQTTVNKTKDPRKAKKSPETSNLEVLILEDHKALGDQVEQWAVEYTSKFVHAAGPNFYTTTMAQILGTAYVKKGLPESPLVAAMLRVSSVSFVLRAGVKFVIADQTSPSVSPIFRTIQARIDSILYSRLKLAERDLFHRLQAVIFRTAGCLNKDQLYPVALVMWQLMRFMSIASSHLSNIVDRFGSNVSAPAEYLSHCQRLLLSVHLALFRTSTPLLLDFRPPSQNRKFNHANTSHEKGAPTPPASPKLAPNFNRSLLGDDDELCRLAVKMRKVVLEFQRRGVRKEMKGSMGWRKDVWELYRGVYNGL